MKKPLLVIIALLVIGIGIALIIKLPSHTTIDIPTQNSPLSGDISSSGDTEIINSGNNQELSGSVITGSQNPLVYTNTEFGFQLSLPEGWEDYKAFVYNFTTDDNLIAMISITLPTITSDWIGIPDPKNTVSISGIPNFSSYIKGYATTMNILIQTHDSYTKDYEACIKNIEINCSLKDVTLGNNKDYYFTYIIRQELPIDIMSRIQLFPNWIEIIKSSFHLI